MAIAELSYVAAAAAGAISFLSPCVLPIVPGYLCFVAGTSLDRLTGEEGRDPELSRRVISPAVAFVLGFSAVFITMGASASAINVLLFDNIGIVSKVAGAVIILFGIHYMGLLRIRWLDREIRFNPRRAPIGLTGAFVVGLAFAFGWTPCIGPILATILSLAAANDSLTYGVSLLGTYALGLGVPFIAAAFAVRPFMAFLVRFRRHLRRVEIAAGGLLVATGLLIFTGSLSWLSYLMLDMFPALGAIG
jgi:cytochrome c-type biogenesis protein